MEILNSACHYPSQHTPNELKRIAHFSRLNNGATSSRSAVQHSICPLTFIPVHMYSTCNQQTQTTLQSNDFIIIEAIDNIHQCQQRCAEALSCSHFWFLHDERHTKQSMLKAINIFSSSHMPLHATACNTCTCHAFLLVLLALPPPHPRMPSCVTFVSPPYTYIPSTIIIPTRRRRRRILICKYMHHVSSPFQMFPNYSKSRTKIYRYRIPSSCILFCFTSSPHFSCSSRSSSRSRHNSKWKQQPQ